MYGYFTHGTVPPSRLYSSGALSLPTVFAGCLPQPTSGRHCWSRSFRLACGTTQSSVYRPSHAFAELVILHVRPSTDEASLAISLSLIGLLTLVPPRDSVSPPEVTRCSS